MKTIQKIMLDKERHIKFGVHAYVAMEKAAGAKIQDIDFEALESVFIMIYAGLIHQDKTMTVDKVMNIIDKMIDDKLEEDEKLTYAEALELVITPITEALTKSMGEQKKVKALPKK